MDELDHDQLREALGGAGVPPHLERQIAIPIISALGMMAPGVRALAQAAPEVARSWAGAAKQYRNFMVDHVYGGHPDAKLIHDEYLKALFPSHLLQ